MLADIVTMAVWGALLFIGVALLVLVAKVLFKGPRNRRQSAVDQPTAIDIPALDGSGPTADGPQLEVYGTAVRLAVLVLAPVGREGILPSRDQLPEVMDNLVPGLMSIVSQHQPVFRRWPQQLSTQGFIQSFFNQMSLPGERGKSTTWCSVAGRFESRGTQYLAGLVCCADKPNGLSEFVVEHAGQWLDVVRIRQTA